MAPFHGSSRLSRLLSGKGEKEAKAAKDDAEIRKIEYASIADQEPVADVAEAQAIVEVPEGTPYEQAGRGEGARMLPPPGKTEKRGQKPGQERKGTKNEQPNRDGCIKGRPAVDVPRDLEPGGSRREAAGPLIWEGEKEPF